ncbi:hypothetical protein [Thermococcus sp. LS2]|uniref:hypothetical protein n=1 Tax=Thermococcus sp. LS2 TaxID=1638260 RepID=UPI00143AA5BD|nr:hypothetical protein [Thermococcus sp. LS2]NJE13776.1 hypothetical protein [Thermococcus sp. LS2]
MKPEDDFYSTLIDAINNEDITVKIKPLNLIPNYKRNSPDFVLILNLTLKFFSYYFDIELPIPIELEKAGINAALEDLRKFVERKHFEVKLPMIVVSGDSTPRRKTEEYNFPVRFEIKQISETSISNYLKDTR